MGTVSPPVNVGRRGESCKSIDVRVWHRSGRLHAGQYQLVPKTVVLKFVGQERGHHAAASNVPWKVTAKTVKRYLDGFWQFWQFGI
jgi:hypothetical protein